MLQGKLIFYPNFSKSFLFPPADHYEKCPVPNWNCGANYKPFFCFLSDCRYHTLLSPRKVWTNELTSLMVFSPRNSLWIACTMCSKAYSTGECLKKGQFFSIVYRSVSFIQHFKGIERMPSATKRKYSRNISGNTKVQIQEEIFEKTRPTNLWQDIASIRGSEHQIGFLEKNWLCFCGIWRF